MSRHSLEPPEEPAPHTRGILMNWAAAIYDRYCPLIGLGDPFRHETLRHAVLQPGEQVLDVGCGTGVLTRHAADAVGPAGHAVGIDPGVKMIRVARARAAQTANSAEFKVAAIEQLPFPDEHFDAVLSSLMLHHLPPDVKRAGLCEVYRVLKPGGRLVAVDIDRPENAGWWLVIWPLLLMPTAVANVRGEIPACLREAGFQAVEAKGRWAKLLTFWAAVKP